MEINNEPKLQTENNELNEKRIQEINKNLRDGIEKEIDELADNQDSIGQKAFNTLKGIVAASTVIEAYVAESAREAGFNKKQAELTYYAALTGDYAIPGVPVGSAAVMAVVTAIAPGAPKKALKKMLDGGEKNSTKAGEAINNIKNKFTSMGDTIKTSIDGFLNTNLSDPDVVNNAIEECRKDNLSD